MESLPLHISVSSSGSLTKPRAFGSARSLRSSSLRLSRGLKAPVFSARSTSRRCSSSADVSTWEAELREVSQFRDREKVSGAAEIDGEREQGEFKWLEQWYPVAVLKELDKRQPFAQTIVGRDLVTWWDRNAGRWQVFEDTCPHRMAPLSEGRIHESGNLQCSYHGWQFASSGACASIPQLEEENQELKNSKRACARVYVSAEHVGMIWVWLDRAPGAEERAAANPPPSISVLSDPDYVHDLWSCDVNYGYETLTENLLDPSHVPFAHHNIQGNRNSGKPLNLKVGHISSKGFEGLREGLPSFSFQAPCLLKTDVRLPPQKPPKGHPLAVKLWEWIVSKKSEDKKVRSISTLFLSVPVAPGKSKVFTAFPRNVGKWVYHLTPGWWRHQIQMAMLDSDHYLLRVMEHQIEERGGVENLKKLNFTPARSDEYPIAYRKWVKTYGDGGPDYGPKRSAHLPPIPPKMVLMDRSSTHVSKCRTCSTALRNFKKLESILQVLPIALIGLLVVISLASPHGMSTRLSIPIVCLAVIGAFVSQWLTAFIKKRFEYAGYNHALVE